MKILITGHNGFIGKNTHFQLKDKFGCDLLLFGSKNSNDELKSLIDKAEIILHFAGVNKSKNESNFDLINAGLTKTICKLCEATGRKIPIIFTSSIHVNNNNVYGKSKLAAEDELVSYSKKTKSRVHIFRLPHVVGKWCRPNYNSVVATFCNNIARNKPIKIFDEHHQIEIVYIDDFIEKIYEIIINDKYSKIFCNVEHTYKINIKDLSNLIYSFKDSRFSLNINDAAFGLKKALYSTYISYLPKEEFSYRVKPRIDERGKFVEFIKSNSFGQISFLSVNPGKVRGGHYHHTKIEKFLLLSGKVNFRFRNILTNEFYEILVSDNDTIIVESIPGWTHDIESKSSKESIIIIWANEIYDPKKPDTIIKSIKED